MTDDTPRPAATRFIQVEATDEEGGLHAHLAEIAENRSKIARQQLERERRQPVGEPMSNEQARTLTDRIKRDVEQVWRLIEEAYLGRAWIALGYESWDVYCIREFGTARLRIPREERPEMVRSLRDAGLSYRAIASATGTGVATIHRDITAVAAAKTGVPNGTGDDDEQIDEDALAEELIAAEPNPILGTDGKTYQPRRPEMPPAIREAPTHGRLDDDDDDESDYITGRFADWLEVTIYVDEVAEIGLRRDDDGQLLGTRPDLATPLTAADLPPDDDRWKEPWEDANRLRAALPRIQELIELLESAADRPDEADE